MGLGSNIKKILQEKNITIKELSEKTGISVNTLYAITKRDSKSANIETLIKISQALDVPINTLVDDGVLSLTNSMLELYGNDSNIKEVNTLAAHFEGEEFTDEEIEEIMNFVEFVKNKRN